LLKLNNGALRIVLEINSVPFSLTTMQGWLRCSATAQPPQHGRVARVQKQIKQNVDDTCSFGWPADP